MPDTTTEQIPCPFIFANGKRCASHIVRARVYGNNGRGINGARKYRLWCKEKWDHAGAVRRPGSGKNMIFYPEDLAPGVEEKLWTAGFMEE